MPNVKYGFDAPGIMRNLILFGVLIITISSIIFKFSGNLILNYINYLIILVGFIFFILGIAMLVYGLKGKYRTRDLMLSKIDWTGKENVLDIGTGQGLLMNGAAKKLTTTIVHLASLPIGFAISGSIEVSAPRTNPSAKRPITIPAVNISAAARTLGT